MDSLGAGKIVDSKLQNFFEIKVDQGSWANVNKIMLDPSCSGSGMAHKRFFQKVVLEFGLTMIFQDIARGRQQRKN